MAKLVNLFSEGSLLKRTLLHVGTLVLGTIAFISIASVVLVSVAKGMLPGPSSASGPSTAEVAAGADDEPQGAAPGAKSKLGGMRHGRKRLGGAAAAE